MSIAEYKRKIQKLTSSSYCIILPHSWITAQKLSKGDVLTVSIMREGDLLISQNEKTN